MEKSDGLCLIFGDDHLGIRGRDYHALFSYSRGGLTSLSIGGKEWVYRPVQPTYWRATTDNDRGSGFPLRAAQWLGADLFHRCVDVAVTLDGKPVTTLYPPENDCFGGEVTAQKAAIIYTYETLTVPAAHVTVKYEALWDEGIRISARLGANAALPPLPCFGLRMVIPTAAEGFTYEGLSGETYPDRCAGAERGIFDVEGLPVTPYLVPQACGMHMDTRWMELRRSRTLNNGDRDGKAFSLRLEQGQRPFAFSCLPYTAQELENAWHQEELPPKRRTVLCVYGAVRGVGGVNSWGGDVLKPYHIDTAEDISFDFRIKVQ